MIELYVSDLHIGLMPDDRLLPLADFAWKLQPTKIVCHGDTFHLNEVPLVDIYRTKDWRTFKGMAAVFPTEVIKGNHDVDLTPDDITPAFMAPPYLDVWGYYHSHWHEYDPISKLPHWWHELWAKLIGAKTPYQLLQPHAANPLYLDACQIIHTNLMNDRKHKGYIGGHTHLPCHLAFPDLNLDIWNTGDWVDSKSCIVRTDDKLEIVPL